MTTVTDLFKGVDQKLPLKERLKKADSDINAMTEEILKMYGLQKTGGVRVISYADTTEELNEEGRYNTRTHVDIGEDISKMWEDEGVDVREVLKDVADYDLAGIIKGMGAIEGLLKKVMITKAMSNKDAKKFSIGGDSDMSEIPEEIREWLSDILRKIIGKGDNEKPKKKKKKDDEGDDDTRSFLDKLKDL